MKTFFLVLLAMSLLAGCGSTVKLDNVPVEDKAGTSISQIAPEGAGSMVNKGGVASVELDKSSNLAAIPTGPRVIYFDYDSFTIKPEFQTIIEKHARYIKMDKVRKVAIEGHTDERGGREYNLALGQKRADAVVRALKVYGVGDKQLEAVSFGSEKPAIQGHDEAAWAQNRRVDLAYPNK